MSLNKVVHVAVAVIKNQHGQFLIAKRHKNSHQGGLWEFPGGKIEHNEFVLDALKRELFEELGITLIQASPLIKIPHNYSDKSVLLDVWCVEEFTGNIFGKEEQEICWINSDRFPSYDFPAANLAIIQAIQLPDKYMITAEFNDENELLANIKSAINKGIKLIQFRFNGLEEESYFNYSKKIYTLCKQSDTKLLLNTPVESYSKYKASQFSHGLHLKTKEINFYSPDLFDTGLVVSASVHNENEMRLAEEKEVDFSVLSPVNKTSSHPDVIPLGWEEFSKLTENATIPVYALGGMTDKDIDKSKISGGQGIAAISLFKYTH